MLHFLMILVLATTACRKEVAPAPEISGSPQAKDTAYLHTPIRKLVKASFPDGNVYIGVATHYRLMGTPTMDTADAEFGYITPANDFKQSYIHPVPGEWKWEYPDGWVAHCKRHGQVIRMHSPISPQCSKWARDDSRTAAELDTMLHQYVTALCRRYNGQPGILWMDVVNETIDKTDAGWFGPKPGNNTWENPWPIIGYDSSSFIIPPLYIKEAFTIANAEAPDVKQIINQHGALEEQVWNKMKYLVEYLRNDCGLRVDGVGWQAHIDLGWEKIPGNLERLDRIIKWCHANDLAFHITEFNVWLKGDNAGKWNEQAATFKAIAKVVLDNRDSGVVGINFWQLRPSDTMHNDWDGCLFDNNLNPKPAYYAIKKLISEYKK